MKQQFNDLLSYDPLSGELRWKVSRRGHVRAGHLAGKVNYQGYRVIKVNRVSYMAHRIAWIMTNGSIPDGYEIDHIDRRRDNNSLSNLRVVTRQQNCRNTAGWSNKPSGLPKGVTWDGARGKWLARLCVDGKTKNLGRFDSPHDAARAYEAASAA